MSKFVGLVCATTYEPSVSQVEKTVQQLAALATDAVVFDNTETRVVRALVADACRRTGVKYMTSGCNDGTAIALNASLAMAGELGYDWLYYLDQDSGVDLSTSDRLNETVRFVGSDMSVALVGSGVDLGLGLIRRSPLPDGLRDTRYVIASGTLMRVSALVGVDGFDECFRLDGVDHEVCLRLRMSGLRLLVDDGRRISHTIGTDPRQLLRHPWFRVTQHPLWRRRLSWRNTVVMVRRYGRNAPFDVLRLVFGRLLDTFLGAMAYREPRYLLAAGRGFLEGVATTTRRVGLSESKSRDLLL